MIHTITLFLREFARPAIVSAGRSFPTQVPSGTDGRPAAPLAERKGALRSHLDSRGMTLAQGVSLSLCPKRIYQALGVSLEASAIRRSTPSPSRAS